MPTPERYHPHLPPIPARTRMLARVHATLVRDLLGPWRPAPASGVLRGRRGSVGDAAAARVGLPAGRGAVPWGPHLVLPPDRSVGTRRPSSTGVVLAGPDLALGVHAAWRPAEHAAHLRLAAPGHALGEIAQGTRLVPDPADLGVAR
jgi:hypothetical protein